MARAGGTAGGGMGGGPDSAPGGSSAAGPGTDGPGNAPGEGMDADAFGGGRDSSQITAKEFKEALHRAVGLAPAVDPVSPQEARAIQEAVQKNKEFKAQQAPATNPAYDPQEVESQVMGTRQRSPSVDLNQVESNVPFDAGAEDDPDKIGRAMQEKGAFLDDREAIAASPSAVGVSLDDPQGTEEGLNQAQVAADTLGARSSRPSAHPSRDTRIGMPFGVGRPASTDQEQNVEPIDQYGRVPSIEKEFETDPIGKKAAYDALREYAKANIESRTTLGKAIQAIVSLLGPMSLTNNIGKVMDMAFTKAGFTTDSQLNSIGLAIRSGQEVSTQGARGAGGVSVGSRDDGMGALLEYVEPWMRGLSDQQIDYYLDRPSELEWVRTTWSKAFGMPSKYSQE
jgi:hypothetical protein